MLIWLSATLAMAQTKGYKITINVTDKETKEAIIMANIQLQPSGALAVTNADGRAIVQNVPEGEYTLQLTYVGYEPINTKLKVGKDLTLTYAMTPTSLSLKEVQVVAKQKESGASTSSFIGRQAINHLQATSLADVIGIVNYILESPADNFDATAADVNEDGIIDVADVVGVVNIILDK